MGTLWHALTDPGSYDKALEHIRFKYNLSERATEKMVCETIRAIQLKQFEFSSPTLYYIGHHKRRPVFSYNPTDYLVSKIIYETLTNMFTRKCSNSVYSYIPGRNHTQAITYFLRFLKQHTSTQGKVDLWIVKTDIKSFGLSIPVHSNSRLWPKLADMLNQENDDLDQNLYLKELLRDAIRPTYMTEENHWVQNSYGLPTGSPITNIMQNIYLSDLDGLTNDDPDIFYARFGDDILIAGQNKKDIIALESILSKKVNELELTLHPQKHQRIYFSKNGYKPLDAEHFIGSNSFQYLGYTIHANGTKQPSRYRLRSFLIKCRQSIQTSYTQHQNESMEEQGRCICQQLKRSLLHFDLNNILDSRLGCNAMLRTNQHAFLKEVDRKIALMIAETLSMHHGLKAFRFIPYKKIRNEWHLPSLVQLLNQFYSSKLKTDKCNYSNL